jgi:hypothetical protein
MTSKRFQVGSKVFLRKTGIRGIIQENQGSKTWKIELVDPNGKLKSIYKDTVKSSNIRNPKENEFPSSSEELAEHQQQQKKRKQTKKKDADESKEEDGHFGFLGSSISLRVGSSMTVTKLSQLKW